MKTKTSGALFAATLLTALAAFPQIGEASSGYVRVNVNLRAGPDVSYPALGVISHHTPVEIIGCLDGWTWCDVAWNNYRGWVSGPYLGGLYHNRPALIADYGPRVNVPIITFEQGVYWDRHYPHRTFYRGNDRWRGGGRDRHDFGHNNIHWRHD